MEKPKKKIQNLEQLQKKDHPGKAFSYRWSVDVEGSGQRKRYLRSIKEEQLKLTILAN